MAIEEPMLNLLILLNVFITKDIIVSLINPYNLMFKCEWLILFFLNLELPQIILICKFNL